MVLGFDAAEVDQEGKVAVTVHPRLTSVVEVMVRLVVLAGPAVRGRSVPHTLQRH